MISSYFHAGSGVGDQLFRFITSRTIAEKMGVPHGMEGAENCKVLDFMKLPPFYSPAVHDKRWEEKCIRDENGVDVISFDPESQFLEPNTIIDGSFEDDKYWRNNLKNINEWLKVEPLEVPNHFCVVGFRGGEYAAIPELFLPKEYYETAVAHMRELNPKMQFHIHTDDPLMANEYLKDIGVPISVVPNYMISHSKHTNMGLNWRSARYAKYAIIPNSAFFIIPRILKHHEDPTAVTIAPRYWARRNTKIWARPACYYPEFTYI